MMRTLLAIFDHLLVAEWFNFVVSSDEGINELEAYGVQQAKN